MRSENELKTDKQIAKIASRIAADRGETATNRIALAMEAIRAGIELVEQGVLVDLEAKLERYDDMLCTAMKFITAKGLLDKAPDNIFDWWESRIEKDVELQAQMSEARNAALAKLTPEERLALGL